MRGEMYDEERIAELLRTLPEAPEAWVLAAARLPATRRAIDQIAALAETDEGEVLPDSEGDVCGHGTACAGIVRSLAPECEIVSVRVLGAGYTGSGPVLMAGLEWAVDNGFQLINMSLSTTKRKFSEFLHELADDAYFNNTMIVASAHNM